MNWVLIRKVNMCFPGVKQSLKWNLLIINGPVVSEAETLQVIPLMKVYGRVPNI